MSKNVYKNRKLKLILFILLVLVILVVKMSFVSAEDGVYFYQPDEKGVLKPVLVPFQNGEINIGNEDKRVYSSADGNTPRNLLGYMKNVKIRKEGGNYVVEFKENGKLSKFSTVNQFLEYNYDGAKSGGKFYLDSRGEMIKANFESSSTKVFYLNGFGYEVPVGTQFNFENKETIVKLLNGGSFSYFNEKDIQQKDIKKISYSSKNGGEFRFDKNGALVKADFKTSKETEVAVKGNKYKAPENTEVKIDGKKVDVKVPDGTKLEAPTRDSGADSEVVFSFQTQSGGALTLPDNELFESKAGNSVIYYDKNGFYLIDKNAVIKNPDGKDGMLIYNSNSNPVYLVFDKSKIIDNSIYLGTNEMIITSLNGKGAAVFFTENNRFGIGIDSTHTAAVQANKGKVFVESGGTGKLATVKISGESMSTLDKRSFFGENGKLYFNPDKKIESDFNYGRYSTAVKLSYVDNNGNRLLNGFDVYSNYNDQYASVIDGRFQQQGSLDFFKTSGNFYVSSTVAFNQLIPSAQKFYSEMKPDKQQALSLTFNNGEKESIVGLQNTLDKLIIEEENIRRNPYRASVRIPSGGGSGTIIGIDNNGYPIVLTAGHLGGATSPGYRERIQMADGRQFTATVLGGYSDWSSGSGWDVSLMRIDTQVEGIPYVPVAPETHVVNQGDAALRIGCPGCGQFKYTNTRVGSVGNSIGVTDYIYGGESGGGLFHQGRIIGVVSTDGHYSGTTRIREFLRKNGYDYLIKIIMIYLK